MSLIAPHGGILVNRVMDSNGRNYAEEVAKAITSVVLSPREQGDLELLAIGGFSPLIGFQGKADVERVCKEMRLEDGTLWPIPVTLSPSDEVAAKINVGDKVALRDSKNRLLAILTVEEKFKRDKNLEVAGVYGTEDEKHPGVAMIHKQGNYALAGPIDVVNPNYEPEFLAYRLTPVQTREAFAQKGWTTVAAFQTRNPIHRSHEYLTKVALEMTDGLLIHPVVGETKADDIPADVRMACYETLIAGYYNASRTMLSVLPLAMRYAGPREAILHAIIRQNYGVSHFIVGRDHAGVGSYYGTYDAQKLFDTLHPGDLHVTPLKFENTFYCKKTKTMASSKTTNSGPEDQVFLSGTKVRDMLKAGTRPPEEFSRPEVADILIKWAQSVG